MWKTSLYDRLNQYKKVLLLPWAFHNLLMTVQGAKVTPTNWNATST